jgi:glycosyltransferase involved in cell wall biosynthesis
MKVLMRKLRDFLVDIFYSSIKYLKSSKKGNYGVNFIGFYNYQIGLGEAMRALCKSAIYGKIPFLIRKINPRIKNKIIDGDLGEYVRSYCDYKVNCFCLNPDVMYRVPLWLNFDEWRNRYNVGYWFWELPKLPKNWKYAYGMVDEIWVCTDYLAQIMQKTGLPVFKIPFFVSVDSFSPICMRSRFGLKDKFIFLSSFDFNSSKARKNPEAVIQSFIRAFPANNGVVLIIKTSNGAGHKKALGDLKNTINGDQRIVIFDEDISREEMNSLLATCDCYVSLHRAEGLGLGMAEAMYLGKPVIATAYSGNMDFMNDQNAILIPYSMIDVKPGEYIDYVDQEWADPNLDKSFEAFLKIYEDEKFRAYIGENARRYMINNHSIEIGFHAIKCRMNEIMALE